MSESEQQEPAKQSQGLVLWDGFSGLNTQPSRYGIGDKECSIMNGFFPVGNNRARIIADNGVGVFNPGNPIVYFQFANIGATPYAIIFLEDGAVWAMNTATLAPTFIGSVGALPGPVASGHVAVSQWGNQFVLIVVNTTSNGYFVWDGTTFYAPGDTISGFDGPGPIASSSLTDGGTGYAVSDTGTVNTGSGDATYIITSINATGSGSGYATGDTGSIPIDSGDAAYVVDSVNGTGGVTGLTLTNAGTAYFSANNVPTLTGGAQPGVGTGLTVNIEVAAPPGPIFAIRLSSVGVVTGYTLTSPGTGYTTTTNAGTTDGGAQPGSGSGFTLDITVTSTVVPTGISGNAITTFSSRAWIANGANLFFSSPGGFTGFATADGGGSITSNDPTLRVSYIQLVSSNGYLYLIGDSSISYIAGVQTSGSPPTTTFSLQNVDPEVGTPWPDTVQVLGSDIAFANAWGVHVSYGGRAAKVSPKLDGIYNTVANFGGMIPSSAKAILFGRRVWILLIRVLDQVTGNPINKLFLWDQKAWCSCQQTASLIFVQSQEINSVLTAWGTDGTVLYQLFQTPGTTQTKTMQSKLWAPSAYADIKAENRLWALWEYFSETNPPPLTISVDSENGASPTAIAITANTASSVQVIPPQACGQQGALVGFTISTTASDIGVVSVATMPVVVQYRG